MKCIRLMAFLMVLVMLCSAFAACGDSEKPEQTSATSDSQAPDPAATTSAPGTTPVIPTETTPEATLDFGGYNFVFAGRDIYRQFIPQRDTATGDAFNDELDELMETYSFTVEVAECDDSLETMVPLAMSGADEADVYNMKPYYMFPLAAKGYLWDYTSPEIVNLGLDVTDYSRWFEHDMKMNDIFGGVYGVVYRGKYTIPEVGYAILFNKTLTENAGYPADTLYQMVRDYEWDFDAYLELAQKICKDIDGDGKYDVWGGGGTRNPWGGETLLAGGAIFSYRDGRYVYTMDEPLAIEGLEFCQNVFYNSGTRWGAEDGGVPSNTAVQDEFAEGKIGMVWMTASWITSDHILNSTDDFGILPCPKGPNAENYVDPCTGWRSLCMLTTHQGIEPTIGILNILAENFSGDEYLELWRDDCFRGDDQSLEMITDYILPNAVFNLSNASITICDYFESDENLFALHAGTITPAMLAEQVAGNMQALMDDIQD